MTMKSKIKAMFNLDPDQEKDPQLKRLKMSIKVGHLEDELRWRSKECAELELQLAATASDRKIAVDQMLHAGRTLMKVGFFTDAIAAFDEVIKKAGEGDQLTLKIACVFRDHCIENLKIQDRSLSEQAMKAMIKKVRGY